MDSIISDFQERVEELEAYLSILKDLSHADTKIMVGGTRAKIIDPRTLKTMKASCFLMMYNLVESGVRGSMSKLYETLNSESKGLEAFQTYVKDIWIEQNFRNMEPISANQSTYRELVKMMVNCVLDSEPVSLDPEKLNLSGNLDARKIRKLFSKHNISTSTHYRAFQGAELKTIKDQRNSLAHGNVTFSDCGQQYTVNDIISIKKQAVVYMRSSLKNVKKHIERTQYAA